MKKSVLDDSKDEDVFIGEFNLSKIKTIMTSIIEPISIINSDQHAILFVGNINAGKSTLIDFLLGHEFEIDKDLSKNFGRPFLKSKSKNKPFATISTDPAAAQTSYPECYRDPDHENLIYIDSPGFKENRGLEIAIATTIGMELAIQRLGSIKGVVLVIDYNLFVHDKNYIGDLFNTLQLFLLNPQTLISSMMIVFTKADGTVTETTIHNIFEAHIKLHTQNLSDRQSNKDKSNKKSMNDDRVDSYADAKITKIERHIQLLQKIKASNNIKIINVLLDESLSRENIIKNLKLMNYSISKDQFQFRYDSNREEFEDAVRVFAQAGNIIIKNLMEIPSKIAEKENRIKECNELKTSYEQTRGQCEDQDNCDIEITRKTGQIKNLDTQILRLNERKTKYQTRMDQLKNEITSLANDENLEVVISQRKEADPKGFFFLLRKETIQFLLETKDAIDKIEIVVRDGHFITKLEERSPCGKFEGIFESERGSTGAATVTLSRKRKNTTINKTLVADKKNELIDIEKDDLPLRKELEDRYRDKADAELALDIYRIKDKKAREARLQQISESNEAMIKNKDEEIARLRQEIFELQQSLDKQTEIYDKNVKIYEIISDIAKQISFHHFDSYIKEFSELFTKFRYSHKKYSTDKASAKSSESSSFFNAAKKNAEDKIHSINPKEMNVFRLNLNKITESKLTKEDEVIDCVYLCGTFNNWLYNNDFEDGSIEDKKYNCLRLLSTKPTEYIPFIYYLIKEDKTWTLSIVDKIGNAPRQIDLKPHTALIEYLKNLGNKPEDCDRRQKAAIQQMIFALDHIESVTGIDRLRSEWKIDYYKDTQTWDINSTQRQKLLAYPAGTELQFKFVINKKLWFLKENFPGEHNNYKFIVPKQKDIQKTQFGPQSTQGGGDCAFHAILGELNAQGIYECKDVTNIRAIVAEAVRTCKVDDLILRTLIKEAIKAKVMEVIERRYSEDQGIRVVYNQYREFLKNKDAAIVSSRNDFLKQLGGLKNTSARDYINEHKPNEKDPFTQFHACYNQHGSELPKIVQSLPELEKVWNDHLTASNSTFNWDIVFQHQKIIEEYADCIGRFESSECSGSWLLPVELQIIAYVLDYTVKFYNFNAKLNITLEPETFNPGPGRKVVSVWYNGNNHYQRYLAQSTEQQGNMFDLFSVNHNSSKNTNSSVETIPINQNRK